MASSKHPWLGRIHGSGKEARERAEADKQERLEEGRSEKSIILNQKDIQTGKWDSHKLLFTTIGGKERPITRDDLIAFRQNIQTAQHKFTKGITAKQIIDWSASPIEGLHHSDLELASKQITMAVPVSSQNGRVRFITNSGTDSDVTRHHVIVEFLDYGIEAASGASDPRKAAMRMRKGYLKIECDCGKWRYWLRYIATIGGFNAGRNETGYPKIRNPKLQGIGCKHIVRVASEIQSGSVVLSFLTKLMEKAKAHDEAKSVLRTKQEDAEKHASNQARRTTGNDIKTSEHKRQERQAKKKAAEAIAKIAPPKKLKAASKITALDADAREAKLRRSLAEYGIEPTKEQIEAVRNAK